MCFLIVGLVMSYLHGTIALYMSYFCKATVKIVGVPVLWKINLSPNLYVNKSISEICSFSRASLLHLYLNKVNSALFTDVAGSLPMPCHQVESLSLSRNPFLSVKWIMHFIKVKSKSISVCGFLDLADRWRIFKLTGSRANRRACNYHIYLAGHHC